MSKYRLPFFGVGSLFYPGNSIQRFWNRGQAFPMNAINRALIAIAIANEKFAELVTQSQTRYHDPV